MIRHIGRLLASGFVFCVCTTEVASAQTQVAIPQPADPLITNVIIPANSDAYSKGLWSPVQVWNLNPIHMAVMPDGKVTTFGSEFQDQTNNSFGVKFDIWDLRRGFLTDAHRILSNVSGVDSFCSASTLLKTGELWTSGGRAEFPGYPAESNNKTVVLNSLKNAVTPSVGMAYPRYYATMTTLADGGHLVTGGSVGSSTTYSYGNAAFFASNWPIFNQKTYAPFAPEVFQPAIGWRTLMQARSVDENADGDNDYLDDAFGPGDNHWWYPRQWVAPNGKVFGFSTRQMWYLDPNANSGQGSVALEGLPLHANGVGTPSKPNIGASSTAVMYDIGQILQVGGNGLEESQNFPSSELATKIDINNGAPVLSAQDPLPAGRGRQWANATVLPTGRVLLTGGSAVGNSELGTAPVKEAAIWNPAIPPGQQPPQEQQWTIGATATEIRGYHSSAVLLPNGTVLTGGGGAVSGHAGRLNVEVYYPPYLFQQSGSTSVLAPRPRVLSTNALKFTHGVGTISARISAGHEIVKASLVGLGSATHSFDMGQRLYPVAPPVLTVSGSDISFPTPHQNHTPPGYYLLFVTNSLGVPSVGVIVAIGQDVAPPPGRPTGPQFDIDGDGRTDLALWRPRTQAEGGGIFYTQRSSDGVVNPLVYWGDVINGVQDIPVTGDYDGDGKTDLALWRPRTQAEGGAIWYIQRSSDGGVETVYWGDVINGVQDIPIPGDYDGDGKTDLALWRPRTQAEGGAIWYIRRSSDGVVNPLVYWGDVINGVQDIPVTGDYDGDGKTDLALWRPRTQAEGGAIWYIQRSSDGGVETVYWGDVINGVQDIPIPGDYDGDRKTDLALWRPRTQAEGGGIWYVRRSSDGGYNPLVYWGDVINGVQDVPLLGR